MPISGLILTLADSVDVVELAQKLRLAEARLELGELQGTHLPAVLETDTPHQSREVHDWLLTLPGIQSVDVVFVSAENPGGPDEEGPNA